MLSSSTKTHITTEKFRILILMCRITIVEKRGMLLSSSGGSMITYVDLIVMHRSCSSFLVSVKRVSPALEPAIMPALLTSESVNVDLP